MRLEGPKVGEECSRWSSAKSWRRKDSIGFDLEWRRKLDRNLIGRGVIFAGRYKGRLEGLKFGKECRRCTYTIYRKSKALVQKPKARNHKI